MQLQFKLLDDQSSKKFVLNIKYQSYDQFLQNKYSFKLEKKMVFYIDYVNVISLHLEKNIMQCKLCMILYWFDI